jgi:hypothetical protein
MTQKLNPWPFDVRVRERNLKDGSITEKEVEKFIGGLPDLADPAEPFGTSQPALAQPVVVASDDDDLDDEDEDEADEGDAGDGGDGGDAGDGGGDGGAAG